MPWNYISLIGVHTIHTDHRVEELTFEYSAVSECLRELVGRGIIHWHDTEEKEEEEEEEEKDINEK